MPVTFGSSGNRNVIGITLGLSGNRNITEGWVGTGAGNKKFFQSFNGAEFTYPNPEDGGGPGSITVPQGARHLLIHGYGAGDRGQDAQNEDSVWFPGIGGHGGDYATRSLSLVEADEGQTITYELAVSGFTATRATCAPLSIALVVGAGGSSGWDTRTSGDPGVTPAHSEGGTGGAGGDPAEGGPIAPAPGHGGMGADGYEDMDGGFGGDGAIVFIFTP